MKNGLSPHQRLLLARPGDRLVGQVLGQVVALGRRLRRLDRRRALVERRIPLVVLAADEAVEVLEAAAAGRPRVERARRARLPDRHLVALAELRGRVAIELERQRERRLGVGQHRAVAGRGGRDLGDAAHADRVVVAAGEQRLPRRRAQRRGVEARVLQPALRELLEVRRLARPAERRWWRRSRRRRSGSPARWARPSAAACRGSAETSCPDPWRRTWSGRGAGHRESAGSDAWMIIWWLM